MGARVKTDDHEYEKACALADYLQAARNGLHQGMRLGDVIDGLEGVDPETLVYFDFGGFHPQEVRSYRGYYSDLALGWGGESKAVGPLLAELKAAIGKTFGGYKGGDYVMDRETPIWVANWSCSDGVAVVGLDNQGWRIVLRTALID